MSSKIGFYAENIFIGECIKRDIKISKPILDVNGYDFVIEVNNEFKKIQVKCSGCPPKDNPYSYKVNTFHGSNGDKYTDNHCDFICSYLIEHDIWYIIPIEKINSKSIRLPHTNISKSKSKYVEYFENWELLN